MEQFNLDTWLQDKSRKVVTEHNKEVRIICTDINCAYPIIATIKINDNRETPLSYDINGKCPFYEGNDLFFADEEEKLQSIEVPFGAKDSEFIRDEYYIPDGCEARIEGNKVIIEKIQKKNELTEFEKELQTIISEASHWTSDDGSISTYCQFGDKEIKKISVQILDLARKEVESTGLKWKKSTKHKDLEMHIAILEDNKVLLSNYLEEGDYYIVLDDLKSLPKEE